MKYLNINPFASIQPEQGDRVAVKVVACVGVVDDWAAYVGGTGWSDDKVAAEGDKLSKEAAELLFPQLVRAGLQYRR